VADRTVTTRLKLAVTDFVAGGRQAKSTLRDLDRKFTESAGFAQGFRKKLEDAAKRLPPIDIDVNSSAAEVKIAEIRSRLESLSSKTVGVDIDAAAAYSELQALQRELEAIDDKDVAFEVRAGVAQAMSELRAIDSEINRVDGRTASVNVDADVGGALSSIAMVAAALASLPAVTTLAVGVTALGAGFAAAGIGAAAFSAAAVPALSRVNEALKAQESAAKSAGGATGGAGQSAAQAAQQALQLEQAERRLKDAQNERRQAQEDLNRAVEAGRRALEDMNFSLERSILSQKDAALAVREAEARLEEVRGKHAEGKASDLELERAMLSLEMAHQRAREQEVLTQRAKEDTDKANRAGIGGTKEYQKGLERLAQAEAKVTEATAALKQMQLQQKAAMSSSGGGAAKLKDAFADLNKQEIELAKNIKAFKDDYVAWQRALEPDVFPVINKGLDLMRLGLREAGPLAKTASSSLLTLGKDAEKALNGAVWQTFLFNINTQMPAALTGLGRSFISVSTGAVGVIDAFLPWTPVVVGGIEKAAKEFERWGGTLKTNKDFHEFMLFVEQHAPEVWELLKNLATAAGNIGEAVAPLGVGAFSGLGLLAKLLAGMDPEHIRLIALAIIAIKAAQAGLGVARFFIDIPGRLDKVRDGFERAKTAGGRFGDMVGGLKEKASGFGALVGGAALTGGLLILEDRLNKNAIAAGRFAEKIQALAGDNVDSQIKAFSDEIARLKENMGPSLDLGVVNLAPFDWDNSLDKIDALQQKLDDLRHKKELDAIASKNAGGAMATMGGQVGGATEKVGGLNSALSTFSSRTDALRATQGLKQAFDDAKAAIEAANGKLQISAGMTDRQKDAVVRAREQFSTYIGKVNEAARAAGELAGKTGESARKSDEAKEAILRQLDPLFQLAGKNREARDAVLKLAESYGISEADALKAAKGGKAFEEVLNRLKQKQIYVRLGLDTSEAQAAFERFVKRVGNRSLAVALIEKGQAAGGIIRHARGGIDYAAAAGLQTRPQAPQMVSSPTVLYGEGSSGRGGTEAYIPYESRYRQRAIGLLSQVANDFGLQLSNEGGADRLSELSSAIDNSGLQISDRLSAVVNSFLATLGQSGTLTSSIAKVGVVGESLVSGWETGSQTIGDSVSDMGQLVSVSVSGMADTMSGSIDGLTGAVDYLSEAVSAAASAAGGEPGMVAGSGPKSKKKSKSGSGYSATETRGRIKDTGGMIAGHGPSKAAQDASPWVLRSDQAHVVGGGSLGDMPTNTSRVSAPQRVSSSSYAWAAPAASTASGNSRSTSGGTSGGGVNVTIPMEHVTVREDADIHRIGKDVGFQFMAQGAV
jgi:hypothetical protein